MNYEIGSSSFIALFFMIFGTDLFLMVFLTFIVSGMAFVFLYFLFRKFSGVIASVLLTLVLMLLWINHLMLYTTNKEPFVFFFFCLVLLLVANFGKNNKTSKLFYLYFGYCWSMLIFMRIQFFILIPVPLLLMLLHNKKNFLKAAFLFILPLLILFPYNSRMFLFRNEAPIPPGDLGFRLSFILPDIFEAAFSNSYILLSLFVFFFVLSLFKMQKNQQYRNVQLFLLGYSAMTLFILFFFPYIYPHKQYQHFHLFSVNLCFILLVNISCLCKRNKPVFSLNLFFNCC